MIEVVFLRVVSELKVGGYVYGDLLLLYINVFLNYLKFELVRFVV